jgi:AbiV family abortive infection protein
MSERAEPSPSSERPWERGFLEPATELTPQRIEQACEAAFANAADLLDEAEILRANARCSRAYFLAHIACEELGKLPILTTAAVAQHLGHDVDWRRIDRVLRDHASKIKQVLFMDSIVGGRASR